MRTKAAQIAALIFLVIALLSIVMASLSATTSPSVIGNFWRLFTIFYALAFYSAVIMGVVWLVAHVIVRGLRAAPRDDSPLYVLKRRYARGEISRQQYQGMRLDIEA